MVIKRLQPEKVFGELGFLGNIKRTATAVAIGETAVGIIDRASMIHPSVYCKVGFLTFLGLSAFSTSPDVITEVPDLASKNLTSSWSRMESVFATV